MRFTDEQIAHSLASGKLALEKGDMRSFLFAGVGKITALSLAAFGITAFLISQFFSVTWAVYTLLALASIAAAAIAVLAATYLKLRSLKLETIPTKYSAAETRRILTGFFKHMKFRKENNRKDLIIVTTRRTHRAPGVRSERITLILDDSRVYAASICDPEGRFYFRSLLNRSANLNLIKAILSGMRKLHES